MHPTLNDLYEACYREAHVDRARWRVTNSAHHVAKADDFYVYTSSMMSPTVRRACAILDRGDDFRVQLALISHVEDHRPFYPDLRDPRKGFHVWVNLEARPEVYLSGRWFGLDKIDDTPVARDHQVYKDYGDAVLAARSVPRNLDVWRVVHGRFDSNEAPLDLAAISGPTALVPVRDGA